MKFASIHLTNYIGIYNGMGLYDIHIDLTKCRDRIVIIRGDNGSGKSTLAKAMSVFPDPNDSFIPSLPAKKEITLLDGEVLYKLSFIHDIKSNGERDTTKAYITKSFNGINVELNENGNVSSFKEILYNELSLDMNFVALSQLSNNDRGLADKKPAERKRFVNSIISSLDVYNDIYKTLTKRSSNLKSMINSIVAKLSVLGDEKVVKDNLEAVENKINDLQANKDLAITSMAKDQSMISLLDPDGSIQNTSAAKSSEAAQYESEISKIRSIINGIVSEGNISVQNIASEHKRIVDRKNSLIIDNQIANGTIESLLIQKESESTKLAQKLKKLESLGDEGLYRTLIERREIISSDMARIEEQMREIVGDDFGSITKDQYITALESFRYLENAISDFKSGIQYGMLTLIVEEYMNTGKIERKSTKHLQEERDELSNDKVEMEKELVLINSNLSLLEKLNLRPEDCKNDACPFIRDAVLFANKDPIKRKEELVNMIDSYTDEIRTINEDINFCETYNDYSNRFSIIAREIDKNIILLSKFPNGGISPNKADFFRDLIAGKGFEYMQEIYRYIDLANLFDDYTNYQRMISDCDDRIKMYQSKTSVIDEINSDIEEINKAISAIVDKLEPMRDEIHAKELEIIKLQKLEARYVAVIENLDKINELESLLGDCRKILLENSRKMNEITAANSRCIGYKNTIEDINKSIRPLMSERDKLTHSIQMMHDYRTEKDELEATYDFIETLKYYSSPTTGIQLVFMELYMGKIIALANDLLGLLFNGQFVIQPFVINESEFRIPCLGSGYLNDDISSMSSSQIGMISMIISFALLHNSSTKYNIIKLDEIDGPLDYNNRVFFTDVLNRIMDIMGTEQCIMISHNSELQVDTSDVILLKHDRNNPDFTRGNIIWSY